MMWEEINCEEYEKAFNHFDNNFDLTVFSSFTDTTGSHPVGYGYPFMGTIWGINGAKVLKTELKNKHRPNEGLHSPHNECNHWINKENYGILRDLDSHE